MTVLFGSNRNREGRTGVSESLGKLIAFSQARAPYHTDAAEVRPRLPNLGAQMELAERHLCVQFRRSELHAVNHELVRQLQLLRCRCPRCDHDGLQAGAALPAAVFAIPAFGWCLLSGLKLASNPARPFSFIDIMET